MTRVPEIWILAKKPIPRWKKALAWAILSVPVVIVLVAMFLIPPVAISLILVAAVVGLIYASLWAVDVLW